MFMFLDRGLFVSLRVRRYFLHPIHYALLLLPYKELQSLGLSIYRQIKLADKGKEAAMAFGGPASPTFKRFRKKITVFVKNFGNYLLPITQQSGSKYTCNASQPPFR